MKLFTIKKHCYVISSFTTRLERVDSSKYLPKGSVLYFDDCKDRFLFTLAEDYFPGEKNLQVEKGSIYSLDYKYLMGLPKLELIYFSKCYYPIKKQVEEYVNYPYGI